MSQRIFGFSIKWICVCATVENSHIRLCTHFQIRIFTYSYCCKFKQLHILHICTFAYSYIHQFASEHTHTFKNSLLSKIVCWKIHTFTHAYIYTFTHSEIARSRLRIFVHLYIRPFVHLHIGTLPHSYSHICTFEHSHIRIFKYSHIRIFAY